MSFYNDLEKSLLEAIEIEKGNLLLTQKDNMPAPTLTVSGDEKQGTNAS